MKALLRFLLSVFGFVLNLLAVAGLSDQVATWARWLSALHRYLGNPFIYFGLATSGFLVLTVTWAEVLAERKLARAGGITRREFPARLRHWDHISSFTVWQAAWLWAGLEPLAADITGTAAHAALRRLHQDIGAGWLAKEKASSSDIDSVMIDRQELVRYALEIAERPSFLFRHERGLRGLWRRLIKRATGRSISGHELRNQYLTTPSQLETGVAMWSHQNNVPALDAIKQCRDELHLKLTNGTAWAAGRRKIGGIAFDYEKIPKREWKHLTLQPYSNAAVGADEIFVDLRVRLQSRQ